MDKRYAIKNKDLLRTAKNIFGKDLVIDAWLVGDLKVSDEDVKKYGNNKNHVRIERLKVESENLKKILKDSEIDIGCSRIALKFSNGKTVTMSSSEWGDVSIPDFELVVV